MARITVEDCLEIEPNRFQLVHMAIKRAKQILKGSNSSANITKDNKAVVASLREIAAGNVRLMSDQEMEEAKTAFETEEIDVSPMSEADKILSRLGLVKNNGDVNSHAFDGDDDTEPSNGKNDNEEDDEAEDF